MSAVTAVPVGAVEAQAAPADAELRERFAPLFDRIRAEAVENEVTRTHPFARVDELRDAGFGALRVPIELGGLGASVRQLFVLLTDLAEADSNLSQALRQHFFRVELLLLDPVGNAAALAEVAGGLLSGNGTTEPRNSVLGRIGTVVRRADDGSLRLSGVKVYSTGNLYAQLIPVAAVDEDGALLTVTVPSDRAGVEVKDDWTGFGQRLTGSGTTVFTDVRVEEHEIAYSPGPSHLGEGFHQLILLATLAGIAGAAARDATELVAARTRVYFTGTGELPRHDPIVQTALGQVVAAAQVSRATVEEAARRLERSWGAWAAGEEFDVVEGLFIETGLAVDAAQVVLVPLVLDATSRIFDVLGASATERALALDRHWRNARTVSSHNPHLFKARVLGDHALNGTLPPSFVPGQDVGVKPGA